MSAALKPTSVLYQGDDGKRRRWIEAPSPHDRELLSAQGWTEVRSPIFAWGSIVRAAGLRPLFGSQHGLVQRSFIDSPPTWWLEERAASHGLDTDSVETVRALIDVWAAERSSIEEMAQILVPALRRARPNEAAVLTDDEIAAAIRGWVPPLLDYAQSLRPTPAGEGATLGQQPSMQTGEVRALLGQRYGAPVIDALASAGRLQIVQSAADLPEWIRHTHDRAQLDMVSGLTTRGQVTLVAEKLTPSSCSGVFLHEMGEHASLETMLGPDYLRLVRHFNRLLAQQDSYATWAALRVPSSTPQRHIPSERLAYLVERVANEQEPRAGGREGHRLGQQCLAQLRAWFFQTPTARWLDEHAPGSFTLAPADFANLAHQAVLFTAAQAGSTTTDDANPWASSLDAGELSDLLSLPAASRSAALEDMDAARAVGYLYVLTLANAPEIMDSVQALWPRLVALAGDPEHERLHQTITDLVMEVDGIQARAERRATLERTGSVCWIDPGAVNGPRQEVLRQVTLTRANSNVVQMATMTVATGEIRRERDIEPAAALAGGSRWSVPLSATAAEALMEATTVADGDQRDVSSAEFRQWFANSQVVDAHGQPLRLFHGTAARFETFSASASRIELNDRYHGDGFFFTAQPDVAGQYATASRNQTMRQDQAFAAVAREYPPEISQLFQRCVHLGRRDCWPEDFERTQELLQLARRHDLDLDSLLDVAAYVEGARDDDQDAGQEVFKLLTGQHDEMPEWVRDEAVALRIADALPNPSIVPVYLRAERVLHTASSDDARMARARGYDAVCYNGPDTVGGQPEWIVYEPDQIRSAIQYPDAAVRQMVLTRAKQSREDALAYLRSGALKSRQDHFDAWFRNSKVRGDDGKPLVVYHGTTPWEHEGRSLGDIVAFDRMASVNIVRRAHSIDTVGSWFSTNPGKGGAEMYGRAIYPVHLSIQNPQETTFHLMLRRARLLHNGVDDGRRVGQAEVAAYRTWLKECGKDGIKIVHDAGSHSTEFADQDAWIALEPEQIKSAIGNVGLYSSTDPDIRFRLAYHGSPHLFDSFSLDEMGSGEGSQAFGWGLYFAEERAVAEFYRNVLTLERGFTYRGDAGLRRDEVLDRVTRDYRKGYFDSVITAAGIADRVMDQLVWAPNEGAPRRYAEGSKRLDCYRALVNDITRPPGAGYLYEVEIPDDDELLLGDQPLASQSAKVLAAFCRPDGSLGAYEGLTGLEAYRRLASSVGGSRAASEMLNGLGIRGLKYLDAMHRGMNEGTSNFVIWDESAIAITRQALDNLSAARSQVIEDSPAVGISPMALIASTYASISSEALPYLHTASPPHTGQATHTCNIGTQLAP